jgi:hypothetical protein
MGSAELDLATTCTERLSHPDGHRQIDWAPFRSKQEAAEEAVQRSIDEYKRSIDRSMSTSDRSMR